VRRQAGGEGRGEQQEGGERRRLGQRAPAMEGGAKAERGLECGRWVTALWINRPFGTPTPFMYFPTTTDVSFG
jgi:hypothetical protein